MPQRIEQVNELLRSHLAIIINQNLELENGLVTIINMDCSADLRQAKVGVSVLPENISGTALKKLRQSNSLFSRELRKVLKLRRIPKFSWFIDPSERHAVEIDKVIDSYSRESGNPDSTFR